MSHPPGLGYRIAAIDYSEKLLRCSCGPRMEADGEPGLDSTNAALEAAWLEHRREVGERQRTLASGLAGRYQLRT
jgi:hypothetical protein